MRLLIGTFNDSRVNYFRKLLKDTAIKVHNLKDFNITIEAPEIGKNTLDNADIKAKSYAAESEIITVAVDSGLYFDNVNWELQPGPYVKRVNGRELNDIEMINYYSNLVESFGGVLSGYWLISFSIATPHGKCFHFEVKNEATFIAQPSKKIIKGLPLHSIQINPKTGKYKSESDDINDYNFDANLKTFILSVLSEV